MNGSFGSELDMEEGLFLSTIVEINFLVKRRSNLGNVIMKLFGFVHSEEWKESLESEANEVLKCMNKTGQR